MRWVLAAIILGAASSAHAATLYEQLGGMERISRFTATMIDLSVADPRTAEKFDNSNLDRLKRVIAQHLCTVADGPCTYTRSLRGSHVQLELTQRHFYAVVENLQTAMDREGIPFRVQNRLLARLAPMIREVVTR
jgi:hemoglobin